MYSLAYSFFIGSFAEDFQNSNKKIWKFIYKYLGNNMYVLTIISLILTTLFYNTFAWNIDTQKVWHHVIYSGNIYSIDSNNNNLTLERNTVQYYNKAYNKIYFTMKDKNTWKLEKRWILENYWLGNWKIKKVNYLTWNTWKIVMEKFCPTNKEYINELKNNLLSEDKCKYDYTIYVPNNSKIINNKMYVKFLELPNLWTQTDVING